MTPKWCEDDLGVPKSDGERPNSWEYDDISPHISKATKFGERGVHLDSYGTWEWLSP